MSKKNLVVVVIVLMVVLVAGYLLNKKNSGSKYSVVYMNTGEVYVGNLSIFPNFKLTNGYILQASKDVADPTKSNFQLQPVNQTLWAPKSMYINRKNIIFYGELLPNSRIVETIKAQK
jgi:hypothetical protein